MLNKNYYLDFYPIDGDNDEIVEFQSFHQIASHSIAKIDISKDDIIEIKWFKNRKIKIAHEIIRPDLPYSQESYIITATTEEIQHFITKYGNDPAAFDCEEGVCISLISKN